MKNISFYKGGKAFYSLMLTGILLSFSPLHANSFLRQNKPQSQQFQIQGTVTDGTNPMPGVSIAIKNKEKTATVTDYNGQYSLSASPQDTLVYSFIGFKTAVIPVNGRSTINIAMHLDATTLQEVKINAGYYSVKESERTGSIARITAKDIETQPVSNVLATMQGRMAGVSVTQTTGVPGGGFEIKIRGQNSIRTDGNAPLYIIDGVPYASDPIGFNQTSTTFPTVSSPLNSINPANIESIEILKDADATAIYGSRGANGVVLLTTKKGRAGKTTFNITASTGTGTVTKFLNLMETPQYLAMRKQAFINDGLTEYNPWDYDVNGTWSQDRNTDWQKELLGNTAVINDVQGTISGGSEKTQFLLSGNFHSESTVFKGDFLYKRGGGQVNINHRSADDKFKVTFSSGYTVQNNDQPASDFSAVARSLSPNAPALYDEDGNLNWENGTWQNPLRLLNAKFESKTNDLVANSVLSYELAEGLTLKSSLGYTNLTTAETRVIPSTIYNPAYQVSSSRSAIYSNDTHRSSWIIEPQISWEKDMQSGRLSFLAGTTFQNQITAKLYQVASGFISNSLIYNKAAAKYLTVLNDDETLYRYQAFFGRLNYNWQKKYIVNATARRDGSSRFGPGKQFANFGALGMAWLFSNENFLKGNTVLSFGKIRSSYGTTGNDQIGDYQYLNSYTASGVNYNGVTGLSPTSLYNPDFGWETNKKLEAAVELGFLQDKIFVTAAWYQNRSSNQLVGTPLPGTTGFTSMQSNLNATVENTGLEFTLRTENCNGKDFKWTTNFNLTFPQNKLIEFPGLENSSYNQKYRIGEPLNIALAYKYKRINAQTGIYEFEDVNNDNRISFPEDRQTVINLTPDFYGGLQNQLSCKQWKLDFLFQFVKQKGRLYAMGPAGMMSNQQERMSNSWQEPGDTAPYQIYTTGLNNEALTADYLYSESDLGFTDASFIRLKNISLSYELPLFLKATQCKIMLQSQNLLTFTKFEDGDPEFGGYRFLPPLKVITAGVQLIF